MGSSHSRQTFHGACGLKSADQWQRSPSRIRQPSEREKKRPLLAGNCTVEMVETKLCSQQNGVVNFFPDGVVGGVFGEVFFSVS